MKKETFSPEIIAELQRRAGKLSQKRDDADKDAEQQTMVVELAVGEARFGLPVEALREIIPAPRFFPVPSLPDIFHGLVQMRGELICLVAVDAWFDLAPASSDKVMAVISGPHGPIGLAFEKVVGFRPVRKKDIANKLNPEIETPGKPIGYITRDLMKVFDIDRLLACREIVMDEQ